MTDDDTSAMLAGLNFIDDIVSKAIGGIDRLDTSEDAAEAFEEYANCLDVAQEIIREMVPVVKRGATSTSLMNDWKSILFAHILGNSNNNDEDGEC